MNDRVKEKAELLPYKGNIWEGKMRVSVDTRSPEPHLKGTVSMSAQLSISAVQLYMPVHNMFKSSTFIYKREEKPEE